MEKKVIEQKLLSSKLRLVLLLFIFFVPCRLLAQDTALVRKQAVLLYNAISSGKVDYWVGYTYPRVIEMYGDREYYTEMVTRKLHELWDSKKTYVSLIVGSPGQFYT